MERRPDMTDVQEAEPSGDLYDILGACNNEELALIVDTLTKTPMSVLKISRAFERHHPEHVQYTDRIGDELYRLSLMALGRNGGNRPAYEAIINGLCRQIGIPAVSNDLSANEANLLNTFSKQHLSTLPPADRQALVSEACTAASTAAGGMLSSDAWPPLALMLIQIIYLRQKHAEEGRILAKSHRTAQAAIAGVAAPVEDGTDPLVIQSEDGHPILSLTALPELDAAGWRGVDEGGNALNLLTPMLKALQPLVATDQMLKRGNYMRVTIPPGAELVYSEKLKHYIGVARGHKGFVRLDPVSAVSLASPAAILTLAGAIAEQKKLENIERCLAEIKSSLNDISRFQKDERRSVLTGSIRYFHQVAPSVLTGELAGEVLQEVERHEVELVRVQEHIAEELRGQIAALRAIKKESWGAGKYIKAIQEAQGVLDRTYAELFLCLRARTCGYQLLCAYPGREAGKKARLEDISRTIDIFLPTGEAAISMDQVLRERIKDITLFENKVPLLNTENVMLDRMAAEGAVILAELGSGRRAHVERMEAISVDIRVQDGQAIAMRLP